MTNHASMAAFTERPSEAPGPLNDITMPILSGAACAGASSGSEAHKKNAATAANATRLTDTESQLRLLAGDLPTVRSFLVNLHRRKNGADAFARARLAVFPACARNHG